ARRLRSSRRLASHEHEIARVDQQAAPLPDREHRVLAMDRVAQQRAAADQAEVPEEPGEHHAPAALGSDPLHEEAGAEQDLTRETNGVPASRREKQFFNRVHTRPRYRTGL